MLDSAHTFITVVYLVSTTVALWVFWRLLLLLPSSLARYLIMIPAVFLAFTPVTQLLQSGYYAPAIAALALEFIDNGLSGAIPYTIVLVKSLAVSLIVAIFFYWLSTRNLNLFGRLHIKIPGRASGSSSAETSES